MFTSPTNQATQFQLSKNYWTWKNSMTSNYNTTKPIMLKKNNTDTKTSLTTFKKPKCTTNKTQELVLESPNSPIYPKTNSKLTTSEFYHKKTNPKLTQLCRPKKKVWKINKTPKRIQQAKNLCSQLWPKITKLKNKLSETISHSPKLGSELKEFQQFWTKDNADPAGLFQLWKPSKDMMENSKDKIFLFNN